MSNPQDLNDRESDFKIVSGQDPDSPPENVVFRPNHQLMARPQLRERDLKPQLVYFYRHLGYEPPQIVYYSEAQAAFMEKSSHKFMLRPIGCSDGKAYTAFIRNCGVKSGEIIPRVKAEKILNDALEAELAEAKKNGYIKPQDQNVHFDSSFPVEQRMSYVPPK